LAIEQARDKQNRDKDEEQIRKNRIEDRKRQ
jgi:hypothetical protein